MENFSSSRSPSPSPHTSPATSVPGSQRPSPKRPSPIARVLGSIGQAMQRRSPISPSVVTSIPPSVTAAAQDPEAKAALSPRRLEFGDMTRTWDTLFGPEHHSEAEHGVEVNSDLTFSVSSDEPSPSEDSSKGKGRESPGTRATVPDLSSSERSSKGKERESPEVSVGRSAEDEEPSTSVAKRKTPAQTRRAADRRERLLQSEHARREADPAATERDSATTELDPDWGEPIPSQTPRTPLDVESVDQPHLDQNDETVLAPLPPRPFGEVGCCGRPWNVIQSLKAIVPAVTVTALSFGAKAYVEKAVTEACLDASMSSAEANQMGLLAGGVYVALSHTFATHLAPAIWSNILQLPGYASKATTEAERQWQEAWTYALPILLYFTAAYIPRGAMTEGSKDLAEIARSKCCASIGAAVPTGVTVDIVRQLFTESVHLERVPPKPRSWENFKGNFNTQMEKMGEAFTGSAATRKWLRDVVFKVLFTTGGNELAGYIWPQSFGVTGAAGEGSVAGGVSMFSFLAGGLLAPAQGGAAIGALVDGWRARPTQANVEAPAHEQADAHGNEVENISSSFEDDALSRSTAAPRSAPTPAPPMTPAEALDGLQTPMNARLQASDLAAFPSQGKRDRLAAAILTLRQLSGRIQGDANNRIVRNLLRSLPPGFQAITDLTDIGGLIEAAQHELDDIHFNHWPDLNAFADAYVSEVLDHQIRKKKDD